MKAARLVRLWMFFFCLLLPDFLWGEMTPIRKIRVGYPPYKVIQEIAKTNSSEARNMPDYFRYGGAASPIVVWLSDSDERLHSGLLLPTGQGKIYEVSNLGGQFLPAAASIDYGVFFLRAPVLLITNNTDSHAIALLREGDAQEKGRLGEALAQFIVPLGPLTARISEGKGKGYWGGAHTEAVEKNVDYQVEQAIARYRERVLTGRLVIAGGIIDLLNVYGHGASRLVLININGEKDENKLRNHPAMKTLGMEYMDIIGRGRRTD